MRNVAGMMAAGLIGVSSLSFVSCGGGGSSASVAPAPAPSNVVSVVVDGGPNNNSVNTVFTTVTVCVPGSTTSCQTIDHIQVDTGSNGLRLLAPVLTLSLPVTTAPDGNSLVECTQFVDGYSWGPIALADIQVGEEAASSVPVQVIGSSTFAVDPKCSAIGNPEETVAAFGANGILGVGVFEQDCGPGCAPSTTVDNSANGFYYSCTTASVCVGTTVALNSQVLNPIRLFTTDNDGSILDLPSVAAPGTTTLTGSLIFGIDTQSNNASGSETILGVDLSGDFTTIFNSQTLTQSFLDSGTNGIFFDDSNLTQCPPPANPNDPGFVGFYCPASAQTFMATLTGTNNTSVSETFTVDNAQTLATNNPTFSVLPTLAGTWSSTANVTTSNTFDWGLPFFYGRRVITAIENQRTAVGTGPYVAF
jgi:Protein of unknown function (DUF3443)